MELVVFEDIGYRNLLPLTYARAAFELRCGVDTLLEKIEAVMKARAQRLVVRPELAECIAERHGPGRNVNEGEFWINGRLLLKHTPELTCPSACWIGDTLAAAYLPSQATAGLTADVMLDPQRTAAAVARAPAVPFREEWGELIAYPWDLIAKNAAELTHQIAAMPPCQDGTVHPGAHLLNPGAIRIESGARIKPTAVLDAEDGPIHVGADAVISPNVTLRGPCSIGAGTLVQAGASIREGTSIGPICKVGGEVEGTIFQGYSNKQHDGFVGHSYVGEWVNLGADTVTSDLKNTYGTVSVPINGNAIDSGLQFVGSIIGDHSKTGICTALTTGCVIGFCCNVVVPRPPQFVPSFTWLTEAGAAPYDLDRAVALARKVMLRRKQALTPAAERLFRHAAETARLHERVAMA